MNVWLTWIGILGCFCVNAEDITVRVISAKDGHAFVEDLVQLVVDAKLPDGKRGVQRVFNERERTDADGKAVFHPDVPALSTITAIAGHSQCSPGTYRSELVLRTGVALNQCGHRPQGKFGLPVHPGEIVIYIGEYSKLEILLYFPWPG